jgi:hypothetical protein
MELVSFIDILKCEINTGCFKKTFKVVFQMLLCGERYENVYT